MKNVLKLLTILIFATSSCTQEVEFGTLFKIQFNNPSNLDFEIISQTPFDGLIDTDNANLDSLFQFQQPEENQIFGVFGNGKFGNSESTILALISGMEDVVAYNLKIKYSGSESFQKTTTMPLLKGVKSIEQWPDKIDKIEFVGFEKIEIHDLAPFELEEKIDSTCINNPNIDLAYGEQEFIDHFELVLSGFKESKGFSFEKMLEHEKHLNSEDVTLGHFWSLGESIYPNEKNFKFDIPRSYKRVECPYFERTTDYFYTTGDKELKVVSFDWKRFKESRFNMRESLTDSTLNAFREKLPFLVQTVSKYLGEPHQNLTEEDGRRQVKWKSEDGINGYLFNFSTYSEIRLYIYKE